MSKTLIQVLALAVLVSAGSAQAFVIDANLADWGVQRNSNASGWTPNSSAAAHKIEDQHNSYLNPGYGGQSYDAEAMYLAWNQSTLFIAIATGHKPSTVNNPTGNSYATGDIAIDFGINGSFDYGIELLGSPTATAGHVYSNVNWALGIWKSNGAWTGYYDPNTAASRALADPAHPTSILSGTDVGTGVVAYSNIGLNNYGAWPGDLHYFYEVAVPLSTFSADWANGNPFRVHWTQNCANDSIWVDATATRITTSGLSTHPVPEPGTLFLLPLGMLGIVAMRRNKPAQPTSKLAVSL